MSHEPSAPAPDALQFDTAHFDAPPAGVACQVCATPIPDRYWQAGGHPMCERCKGEIDRSADAARTRGAFLRAAVRAGAVALACGIAYAAFVGATDRTLGLLTIGIGYLVGASVQKVTRGFGTVRYQVLAVLLTYMAACMGNAVPIVRALTRDRPAATATATAPALSGAPSATATSPATAASTPPAARAPEPSSGGLGGLLLGLGGLLALCLASPFLMLSADGGSGFLSLLIIGFGLFEAWRRAAGAKITFTGPHDVPAPVAVPHAFG